MQKKLILFVLIVGLLFLTGWTRSIRKMGLQGKILVQQRWQGEAVHLMDLATGKTVKFPIKDISNPILSPDGTKIVYSPWASGGHPEELWVANTDGTERIKLTNIGRSPTWSPDGKKIAFYSDKERGKEDIYQKYVDIYVINTNGKNEIRITKPTDYTHGGYDWSPDGKEILFSTFKTSIRAGSTNGLYTVNSDGTGRKQLVEAGRIGTFKYSPDGRKIIFSLVMTPRGVYIMNLDGTEKVCLDDVYPGGDFSWSLDGQKVLYTISPATGSLTLYSVNSAGFDKKEIVHFPKYSWSPEEFRWSPDRKKILFLAGSTKVFAHEIFTINADGSDMERLTHTKQGYRNWNVQWTSDGRVIYQTGIMHGFLGFCDIVAMNSDGSNRIILERRLKGGLMK